MTELFRDTAFGQIVRLVTRNKVFQYPEERDPDYWINFINEEKSGHLAHHGTTDPPEEKDGEVDRQLGGVRTREGMFVNQPNGDSHRGSQAGAMSSASSDTHVADDNANYNHASGVKIDPEKGRDVHLVTWHGDNDPANPQNWSHGKKFFVTFEICLLTFSVYIGSAIYTAGITTVMSQFGVSQTVAILGLTLFVLGYGTGPMIWSPMSEMPFIGRNPIYIGTLIVFVVFQVPTALSKNIGMLLAFRFLTGFFGSPVLATGGATIGDMYRPAKRAYGMGIWGVAAVCGPVMGPLVGGFAAEAEGWTWTIWELMWLSGFCLVFLFFFLPETSATNIIYRRTQRLKKITGDDKLKCEPELMAEQMTPKEIAMMTLIRPITMNFTEPMVFLLNMYIALIYALLYLWFESFPIVFVEMYGFTLGEEGLAFLGILVGALITIPPFFWYLSRYIEPQFNDQGELKPEKRLTAAMLGGFCIPICLFWFGWSAGRTHWIVPIIGSGFFSIGAFLLFNSVLNYLGDAYPAYAASVYAGNDLFRSSFGAAFPLFANAMFTKLGIDWGSSMLAFISICFIPIPFFLYKYGETLRKNHSTMARKDL